MSNSEKDMEKELKLGEGGGGTGTGDNAVAPPKSPTSSNSISQDADEIPINPEAERKLLLKLDLIIWPVFFVIYVMAFLDRINISHAAIQGLTQELQLDVGNRFNVALFVSFSLNFSPLLSFSRGYLVVDAFKMGSRQNRTLSEWDLVKMGLTRRKGLLLILHPPRNPLQHDHPQSPAVNLHLHAHVLLGHHQHVHGLRAFLRRARGAPRSPRRV